MLSEIVLSRSGSTTVRVINDGDTTLRVEARVFERMQDRDGKYSEKPTETIIIFPPIMKVPANASRSLRLMVKPNARKQATDSYYMLQVTQLEEGTATEVQTETIKEKIVKARILYSFHVPIYVYPKKPNFSLNIDRVKIENGELLTWVKNAGNSIVRMKDLRIFVRVDSQWRLAEPTPSPRVQAMVVANTVRMVWPCSICPETLVDGVRIEGNAPHWGNFTIEKIW